MESWTEINAHEKQEISKELRKRLPKKTFVETEIEIPLVWRKRDQKLAGKQE